MVRHPIAVGMAVVLGVVSFLTACLVIYYGYFAF